MLDKIFMLWGRDIAKLEWLLGLAEALAILFPLGDFR